MASRHVRRFRCRDLPFFQRTGAAAATRKTMSLDIRIGGIRMCAGKQELLDSAVLALNFGLNYGLVGRNGVGKTTLLRHLADGRIPLPPYISVVHVEQASTAEWPPGRLSDWPADGLLMAS